MSDEFDTPDPSKTAGVEGTLNNAKRPSDDVAPVKCRYTKSGICANIAGFCLCRRTNAAEHPCRQNKKKLMTMMVLLFSQKYITTPTINLELRIRVTIVVLLIILGAIARHGSQSRGFFLPAEPCGHIVPMADSRAEAMKSSVSKRSIVIAGHKTSVSLEGQFWDSLKEIASKRGMTLGALVAAIDGNREHANLSSTIRLFVLGVYRDQASLKRVDAPILPDEVRPL